MGGAACVAPKVPVISHVTEAIALTPAPPEGHLSTVHCLAFSHDGAQLLSGSDDGTLLLWDVKTGVVLDRITWHSGYVRQCALLPDGRILSAGWGGEVFSWSRASLDRKFEGLTAGDSVRSLAVRPDGRELMVGTRSGLVVAWDIATGKEQFRATLSSASGKRPTVLSAGYLPNGDRFAAGEELGVTWRSEDPRFQWLTATSAVSLPGGLILGNPIGVFSGTSPAQRFVGPHAAFVSSLASSPGHDLVLAVDHAGEARVWSTSDGKAMCEFDTPASLWAAAFSPRGDRFAFAGNDGAISVVRTADCTAAPPPPRRFEADRGWVSAVAAGRTAMLGDGKGRVSTWSTSSWRLESSDAAHAGDVKALAVLPDGRWLSGGSDGTLVLGGAGAPRRLSTLPSALLDIAIDGADSAIVADGSGYLSRVSLDGHGLMTLLAAPRALFTVAVQPSGPLAIAGGLPRDVYAVQANGGPAARRPGRVGPGSVTALAFLPDGRWVEGGTSGDLLIRKDDRGQRISGLLRDVAAITVHGRQVWAGSTRGELVSFLVDEDPLVTRKRHEAAGVMDLAVTSDDRFLIVGLDDGRAAVRSLPDGALVAHLYPFRDGSGATVYADGSFHVSGGLASGLRMLARQTMEIVALRAESATKFGGVRVASLPDGSVEVKTTLVSPKGAPAVTLDGRWPITSVIPSATVPSVYEIALQIDDPMGGAHELVAVPPEGSPASTSFTTLPNVRFAPEKARALLVGNAYYRTGSLLGPAEDLTAMRALLRSPDAWRLPDDRIEVASNLAGGTFRRRVEAFFAGAGEGETFLFYFSGHGDSNATQGYLLPVDAVPGDLGGALSAKDLWTFIRTSKAARVLVVLDACRAGGFILPSEVQREALAGGRAAFLTATSASNASDTPRGGAFTRALIRALARSDIMDPQFFAVTTQTAFHAAAQEVLDQHPMLFGAPDVFDLPLSWPPVKERSSAPVKATDSAGGGLAAVEATIITGERSIGVEAAVTQEKKLQLHFLFDEEMDSLLVSMYQPATDLLEGKAARFTKTVSNPAGKPFAAYSHWRTTLWHLQPNVPALVEVRTCKKRGKCDGPPRRVPVTP